MSDREVCPTAVTTLFCGVLHPSDLHRFFGPDDAHHSQVDPARQEHVDLSDDGLDCGDSSQLGTILDIAASLCAGIIEGSSCSSSWLSCDLHPEAQVFVAAQS